MFMLENQEFWFVARTRAKQELGLRNSLKKMNINCYLPTQIITRQVSDRKKKVEVPVIHNLIFIQTNKKTAFSLTKEYALKLNYLRNRETGSLLVVPDRQMENFMFLMDLAPDSAIYHEVKLSKGDKVRVLKGDLVGLEGEMIRHEGKTHVLINLPDILSVSIKIPKSYLEKV